MSRPFIPQNRSARRAMARRSGGRARRIGSGVALAMLVAGGARAQEPEQENAPEGVEEIEVTGEQNDSQYTVDRSSLLRFTGSIMDTGQTITVIPQQLLEEQGANSLRDALRNVSGIGVAAGEGGSQGDSFTLRGYTARNDMYIDGVRDRGSYARDSFNLESIEVVKGSTSSYFGRGSTGGVINQVSKTPFDGEGYAGSLSAGSGPYFRGTGDINLPLSESVAFRLNLMGHKSDTVERDDVESKRWGLAPSLAFGLGTNTQFTLSYLYTEQDNVPDYGLPYINDHVPNVNRDSFYGLDEDFERTKLDLLSARLDHAFSDAVRVRNTTSYSHVRRRAAPTAPRVCDADDINGVPDDPTTPGVDESEAPRDECPLAGQGYTFGLRRGRPERDGLETILANQTDLVAQFQTGGATHSLAAGVELATESYSLKRFTSSGPPSATLEPGFVQPNAQTPRSVRQRSNTRAFSGGVYLSDRIALSEQLSLEGGLRWDAFNARYKDERGGNEFDTLDRMLSYRASVIYTPTENQTYYASYGTSFNPSAEGLTLNTRNADTDPEKNRNLEVGVKWALGDGRVNLALALFQTEKTDARDRTTDPLTAEQIEVLAGSQRVRGLEFSLAGRLTDDLNVFAGYTFLDGEVRDDFDASIIGNELSRTPRHSASLWATYTPFGSRWTLGGGPTYVSHRYSNTSNSRKIAGYIRWDAMIGYELSENMVLRLNVQNLTDREYVQEIGGGHAVPAPGRTIILNSNFSY